MIWVLMLGALVTCALVLLVDRVRFRRVRSSYPGQQVVRLNGLVRGRGALGDRVDMCHGVGGEEGLTLFSAGELVHVVFRGTLLDARFMQRGFRVGDTLTVEGFWTDLHHKENLYRDNGLVRGLEVIRVLHSASRRSWLRIVAVSLGGAVCAGCLFTLLTQQPEMLAVDGQGVCPRHGAADSSRFRWPLGRFDPQVYRRWRLVVSFPRDEGFEQPGDQRVYFARAGQGEAGQVDLQLVARRPERSSKRRKEPDAPAGQ